MPICTITVCHNPEPKPTRKAKAGAPSPLDESPAFLVHVEPGHVPQNNTPKTLKAYSFRQTWLGAGYALAEEGHPYQGTLDGLAAAAVIGGLEGFDVTAPRTCGPIGPMFRLRLEAIVGKMEGTLVAAHHDIKRSVYHVTLPAYPKTVAKNCATEKSIYAVNAAKWRAAARKLLKVGWEEWAPKLAAALWSGEDASVECESVESCEWTPEVCGESGCPVGAHNAWSGLEPTVEWRDGVPHVGYVQRSCDADGNWESDGWLEVGEEQKDNAHCAQARANYWEFVLQTGREPCNELFRVEGAEDLHRRAWGHLCSERKYLVTQCGKYGRKLARYLPDTCPPVPASPTNTEE